MAPIFFSLEEKFGPFNGAPRTFFKTNKLTAAASQDQSQKPQQEYVFSNLPVSGIQGQTEMKHTKFKTNKLTTAAWMLSGVLYRKVSPQVKWMISELDGTHTGAVVLYYGFDEQA